MLEWSHVRRNTVTVGCSLELRQPMEATCGQLRGSSRQMAHENDRYLISYKMGISLLLHLLLFLLPLFHTFFLPYEQHKVRSTHKSTKAKDLGNPFGCWWCRRSYWSMYMPSLGYHQSQNATFKVWRSQHCCAYYSVCAYQYECLVLIRGSLFLHLGKAIGIYRRWSQDCS
jgi:hypothetical protein